MDHKEFPNIGSDLSLDLLLQETLALTEYLRTNKSPLPKHVPSEIQPSFLDDDTDYLLDLADSLIQEEDPSIPVELNTAPEVVTALYPETPGVIYKIDSGPSTFCVRGFSTNNIREAFEDLKSHESSKRFVLKVTTEETFEEVMFFETATFASLIKKMQFAILVTRDLAGGLMLVKLKRMGSEGDVLKSFSALTGLTEQKSIFN
jgi:hypothetical protein